MERREKGDNLSQKVIARRSAIFKYIQKIRGGLSERAKAEAPSSGFCIWERSGHAKERIGARLCEG